jgi:hypothetical protein
LLSEPILVLGAANILYNTNDGRHWRWVLDTFSKQLCSTGLVEKGLAGELGAQVLLLLARDFVAPMADQYNRNLLKPVLLLDMLDVLFGKMIVFKLSCDSVVPNCNNMKMHVNFTHLVVMKDPLPKTPDQ